MPMESNLDITRLDNAAQMAKGIREWLSDRNHPERYINVNDLELIRDFVHTLDLLETVLVRFEISVHLAKLALEQLENPARTGSLGWEFWQIDVEESFACNLLELCYQIDNAWERIQKFANEDEVFNICGRHQRPSNIIRARHHATHFVPQQFEKTLAVRQYSILRRPYRIRDGKLEKEPAKYTLPKVASLIRGSVEESLDYIGKFRRATVDFDH
jgi:hypothetical protein